MVLPGRRRYSEIGGRRRPLDSRNLRSDSGERLCSGEVCTVVSATENSTLLPGDNPIESHGDDVLERAGLAIAFARRVLEPDASRGATVGIFGPWGSGKTSFVNLARKTFEQKDVPVPDFNPWLFSGAEQLLEPGRC